MAHLPVGEHPRGKQSGGWRFLRRRQYSARARPASAKTKIKLPQPSLIMTTGLGRLHRNRTHDTIHLVRQRLPDRGLRHASRWLQSAGARQRPSLRRRSAAPCLARPPERRSQHRRPARSTTPTEESQRRPRRTRHHAHSSSSRSPVKGSTRPLAEDRRAWRQARSPGRATGSARSAPAARGAPSGDR